MTAYGCVTGRFQPVHAQHLELFELALSRCDHLIVAVTNPDSGARQEEPTSSHRHTDQANPFTYFQRARLINAATTANGWARRVTVVPFDLTRPQHWPEWVPLEAHQFVRAYSPWERQKATRLHDAGYPVTVLDGDPATRQSSSDIRQAMAGGNWHELVPEATVELLEQFLQRSPVGDRR